MSDSPLITITIMPWVEKIEESIEVLGQSPARISDTALPSVLWLPIG